MKNYVILFDESFKVKPIFLWYLPANNDIARIQLSVIRMISSAFIITGLDELRSELNLYLKFKILNERAIDPKRKILK